MRWLNQFRKRTILGMTLFMMPLALLSGWATSCSGETDWHVMTVKEYDISVKLHADWKLMYPRADRSIVFLVNNPGGVRYGTVAFEVSVDLADASTEIEKAFPGLTEQKRTMLNAAGHEITLITYSYHAKHLAGDYDGRVFRARLPRGQIYYNVMAYGEANAFKACEPLIMEMFHSIRFSNPEWKPSESQSVFLKGVDAVGPRGNYSAAIDYFQKAVELDPNHVKARVRLGLAYEQARKFEEAFAEYEAASKMDPSNPDAWVGMGTIMGRKANNQKALEYFLEAVKHAPLDYVSHSKAVEYLGYANRFEEALAYARKSQSLNRDQGPALDHVIKFLEYALKRLKQEGDSGVKQSP